MQTLARDLGIAYTGGVSKPESLTCINNMFSKTKIRSDKTSKLQTKVNKLKCFSQGQYILAIPMVTNPAE